MERRLRNKIICALFGILILPPGISAQETELKISSSTLIKETINGFTIKKSGSQETLPYLHGIDIEIRKSGSLDQPGKAQLILICQTENWFNESEELNTFYFKDFRAKLSCTPGAISVWGQTQINLPGADMEADARYRPDLIPIKQVPGEGCYQYSPIDLDLWEKENSKTELPIQLPSFNDLNTRIRAFEVVIPIEIIKPGGSIHLNIDRIELGLFVEKSAQFELPVAENINYPIQTGILGYFPVLEEELSLSHAYPSISEAQKGITWDLKQSITGSGGKASMRFELTHQSNSRYTGIVEIEMILITPDGSVVIKEVPSIHYQDGCEFSNQKLARKVQDQLPSESVYPEIFLHARKALLMNSWGRPKFINEMREYHDFLYHLWYAETLYDYCIFPNYKSNWNYPLQEGTGSIMIEIPASVHAPPLTYSEVLFKLTILDGDEKSNLKREESLLRFSNTK